MHIEQCRSCGASIIWARHERTGKPAPIDASPVENGNVRLYSALGGTAIYGLVSHGTHHEALHLNHFVTCPNARQHASQRYNKRNHTAKTPH